MGHQILFHMLPTDADEFLEHARRKAPVVCAVRDSDTEEVEPCDPTQSVQTLCRWNESILSLPRRKFIAREVNPYWRIDGSQPVIEFWLRHVTDWDGIPALAKG